MIEMPLVQPCCLLKKKGWGNLKLVGSVMVSKADTWLDRMYIQLDPYNMSVPLTSRYMEESLQFKSLVFEDFDMTFHNWRSLSASHCAWAMVR
jgi:hypothetical protein